MATAVQMTITLDPSGAVQGMNQLKSEMNTVGTTAIAAGAKAESAFNGIESAERRAHIAGQLFARTTGVEMPRALETVISRSQALGPILAGLFNVSIIAAGAAAFGAVFEKISSMAEGMAGYTEEVKRAEEETKKANLEAWLHPEKLSVANAHLQQVINELGRLNEERQKLEEQAPTQVGGLGGGGEEMAGLVEQLGQEKGIKERISVLDQQSVELTKQKAKLEEQLNTSLERLQNQAALAGLTGNKLAAEQHKQAVDQINKEFAGNDQKLHSALEAEDKIYWGHKVDLARSSSQAITSAIRSAQESANTAQLSGLAKLNQEEANAQADAVHQYGQNQQLKNAITLKYAAERTAMIASMEDAAEKQTEALQNQAALSAVSGDDRIRLSAQQRIAAVDAAEKQAHLKLIADPQERAKLEGYYAAQRVAINADADNQITANDEAAAEKRKQILDQLEEDTKTAQEDTVLATVNEWQKGYAQIAIESQKRLAEIDKQERNANAQYGNDEDMMVAITQAAQAKREAVWAQTNQKIIEENKKQVEQLGSDLESVFNDVTSGNIGTRILNNFKKLFFQILAQWLLTTKSMGSGFGSLFGSLIFGPGSSGANFFGGGASPLGMLGGLFGGGGTVMSTPPFFPTSTTSGGSIFAPSSSSGGGLGNVIFPGIFGSSSSTGLASDAGLSALGSSMTSGAATSTSQSSTLGGFGAGLLGGLTGTGGAAGALTSGSISGAVGDLAGTTLAKPSLTNALGGLFSAQSVPALAMMGALLGGSKLGVAGQAGAMISALTLMATMQPGGVAASLLTKLGLGGPLGAVALSAAGGGLLGFGLGEQFGPVVGGIAGAGTSLFLGAGLLGLGPIGLIIAGIIGLLGGIFGGLFGGGKRKKAANNYFTQQVEPAIQQIVNGFESFQLDFTSANSQLEQLRSQAHDQLKKLKGEGKDVFKNKVAPAIDAAEKQISTDETERNRRAGLVFGPPQFHDGGFVGTAAQAWTTKPNELLAVLKKGEFVMNPLATAKNRSMLEHMNAGGSPGISVSGGINLYPAQLDQAYIRGPFVNDVLSALRRAGIEGKL